MQKSLTDTKNTRNSDYLIALNSLLRLLSYTTEDRLHGGGTTHSELDLPCQSLIVKMPTLLPTGPTSGGVLSTVVLFSHATIACIKFEKQTNKHRTRTTIDQFCSSVWQSLPLRISKVPEGKR